MAEMGQMTPEQALAELERIGEEARTQLLTTPPDSSGYAFWFKASALTGKMIGEIRAQLDPNHPARSTPTEHPNG